MKKDVSKYEYKLKYKHKHKFIAGFITALVLIILILAGPVEAFILSLTISDTNVMIGDTVSFIASAEIEAGETIDVTAFSLDLAGPISISCLFHPNGTKISSCTGITIEQIENTSYGYGYGYGFLTGYLRYNITLDTEHYPAGLYSTKLIAITNGGVLNNEGPDLTISAKSVVLEKCSVRAKNGEMMLLDDYFGTKNKLNFNVPKATAVKGSGSLTAQHEKIRFNYKFKIIDILSNNEENTTILVEGKYKIKRGPKVSETATIYLDKIEKIVDITGMDFNITYMDVNFIKGCEPI